MGLIWQVDGPVVYCHPSKRKAPVNAPARGIQHHSIQGVPQTLGGAWGKHDIGFVACNSGQTVYRGDCATKTLAHILAYELGDFTDLHAPCPVTPEHVAYVEDEIMAAPGRRRRDTSCQPLRMAWWRKWIVENLSGCERINKINTRPTVATVLEVVDPFTPITVIWTTTHMFPIIGNMIHDSFAQKTNAKVWHVFQGG